jgi:hypothetical protein
MPTPTPTPTPPPTPPPHRAPAWPRAPATRRFFSAPPPWGPISLAVHVPWAAEPPASPRELSRAATPEAGTVWSGEV